MLNFDGSSSAPNAMMRSSGTPGSSRDIAPDGPSAGPPKYRLTISTGNRSMPAGTGVCVVNTVDDRTTVSAVSKSSPASISSRMRSTPRNPACPSFMWNTSGAGQALDVGERPDRAHAADAGQDLLLDPVFLVAAVQPVGDAAQIVIVLGDVGIQQQQRNSAHLRDPHARPQLVGVRHRQLDQHRVVVVVGQQPQRQALRIQRRIALVLPAVGGQRLPEVPRAVQQADRDQRKAQVRGGLQVIAGQNAQAAGVVRQHLGDAELHREVRDAVRQLRALVGLLLVPQRPGQVVVQIGGELVEAPQERLIHRELVQPLRADLPEQRHRVASDLLPQLGIDGLEQILRGLVPRPAQVDRKPFERGQTIGQMCADGEPCGGLSRDSTLLTFRAACSRGVGIASPPLDWADHYGGYRARRGCNRDQTTSTAARTGRASVRSGGVAGRIEIDDVAPVVSGGRFPAKAVVGEIVPGQRHGVARGP